MTRSRRQTKTLKCLYPAIMLEIYILCKFYPTVSCLVFQHRILYIVSESELPLSFRISIMLFLIAGNSQDRHCSCNLTLRHLRVTNVAGEERITYCVCVCCIGYSACKAHASYFIVTCDLSGCAIFFPFTA